VVAIIGAVVAAVIAIRENRANRRQRQRESRWKQADLGRNLGDELWEGDGGVALRMLDYSKEGRTFEKIPGIDKTVTADDIRAALELSNKGGKSSYESNTQKSIYIRECFEELLFVFDRFEHFINDEFFTFEDVNNPSEYFAEIMAEEKKMFVDFMEDCK
jgi:hypothetical protein